MSTPKLGSPFLGLIITGVISSSVMTALAQEREGASKSPAPAVLVRVEGDALSSLRLTHSDLLKLPRQAVQARAHDGKDARYEGVAVFEILKKAGLPHGKDLRGKAVALYLVVEAADGYRAVFALPELDPDFSDRVILLADRRDGQALSAKDGPLQIIVPGEKRHSRWVRQVIVLRIGRA
jgi:Oxidoreductase molybdopterin binding domain